MNKPHNLLTAGLLAAGLVTGPTQADWQDWLKPIEEGLGGGAQTQGAAAAPSQSEVTLGLREALEVGVERAVQRLGRTGGFLDDPQVRIPLPESLRTVESGLRTIGQDRYADEFIATMNHAAEQAVPETGKVFLTTIKDMTLKDVKAILDGPDDAATRYLQGHSESRLREAIAPIVRTATSRAGVTSAYKQFVDNLGYLGQFAGGENLDLDGYITDKTLDGLFLQLAQEEKRIRQDPAARSTELLKKVFGSVQ